MKNIISFDVGIKNLAYSRLTNTREVTDNDKNCTKSHISLVDWGIINLLNVDKPIQYCVCCKKYTTATYLSPDNKVYCKRHAKSNAKQSGFIVELPSYASTKSKRKSLDMKKLHLLAREIGASLAESMKTKKEILECVENHINLHLMTTIKHTKTKCDEISLVDVGKNMAKLMNSMQLFDNIDTVLIENQISPIANRMKTVQGMLTQYIIMEFQHKNIPCPDILFISSSNKLKPFEEWLGFTKKTTYDERKHAGIQIINDIYERKLDNYCEKYIVPYFLSLNENVFTVFNGHKKKDDLADAFLQGVSYVLKNT